MGACKCRQCRANLSTKSAIKDVIAGKTAYFCNEEHRELYMAALQADQQKKAQAEALRNKFYGLFCGILGVNGITNTALWKEKAELNKVFEDEVIIAYLEDNKAKLSQMVSKLSGGEYGKLRYVGVVLKNNLADFKRKVKVEKVERKVEVSTVEFELFEPTMPKQNTADNIVFEDVEDDLI